MLIFLLLIVTLETIFIIKYFQMADGGEADRGDSGKRCLEEEEGELVCEAPGLGQGFFTWAAHRSYSGVLPWSQLCLEPPRGVPPGRPQLRALSLKQPQGGCATELCGPPWRQVQCTCGLADC